VQGSRYLVGWAVVATIATAVGVGTVVLVRDEVGGGMVVSTLSHEDVLDQLSAAARTAGASRPALPGPSGPSGVISGPPRATHTPTARPSTSATGPTSTRSGSQPPSPYPTRSFGGHGSTPPPSSTPSPSQPGVTGVLSSSGGSVVARCTGAAGSASVYLLSWSPAQGFAVHEVVRGPGQEAEISFDSSSESVAVTVSCSAGGPVEQVETGGSSWGGGGDN
jgi:hypothetical protein